VKRIARDIEPLAAWLKRYKPDCSTITLARADYTFLRTNSQLATGFGFVFGPATIHYQGFEVRSPPESGAQP